MAEDDPTARGLRRVRAQRLQTDSAASAPIPEEVRVVVEAAVSIEVDGYDVYTLLCTPIELEALATGFLLTEGVIDDIDAIAELRPCADDPHLYRVRLNRGSAARLGDEGRNLLITSACGLCGVESLERKLEALPRVGDDFRATPGILPAARRDLRERQTLFRDSGGTHAAGLVDAAGQIVAWAEDAGRHNALDKAIGKCLRAGRPTAGRGAVLSGRVSLDMVAKCARAGVELVSAISAPTSLAVEVAERCGITLCAFVRDTRATVFTHPHRLAAFER